MRANENEGGPRRFILQIVPPGLVGLMDGSVSTLATVFAAAFATQNSHDPFLAGIAASIGAGISSGFAEALADDSTLSGRGTPLLRGLVCGLMTVAGGIGHTLPCWIHDFWTATACCRRCQGHARRRPGAGHRHPDRQQLTFPSEGRQAHVRHTRLTELLCPR